MFRIHVENGSGRIYPWMWLRRGKSGPRPRGGPFQVGRRSTEISDRFTARRTRSPAVIIVEIGLRSGPSTEGALDGFGSRHASTSDRRPKKVAASSARALGHPGPRWPSVAVLVRLGVWPDWNRISPTANETRRSLPVQYSPPPDRVTRTLHSVDPQLRSGNRATNRRLGDGDISRRTSRTSEKYRRRPSS